MKSSQVLARGTARSSTRGRARAQRHRIEIKRELSKIGPRFLPSGRGDDSGADFSPLQFHSFLSFVCLRLFLFISFRFSSFCFVSAERRAQLHLETVARPGSGSSPSPALLGSARSLFWWEKRMRRNLQPGKASSVKEGSGTAFSGRPGPGPPVCLPAGRAVLPK